MMFTSQPKPTSIQPEIISGAGRIPIVPRKGAMSYGFRPTVTGRRPVIRAVISSGDIKCGVETAEKVVETERKLIPPGDMKVTAMVKIKKKKKKKMKDGLTEMIENLGGSFMNVIGQGISIQLISEDIDPVSETMPGKSVESAVRGWYRSDDPNVVQYRANLTVPRDFGQIGAVRIINFSDKEFFLTEIEVRDSDEHAVFFRADTWIHSRIDNPESRIIFKNQTYLPSQTPSGIKDLRREDLLILRGDGKGERKMHERVYDYDVYNDLGNPDDSLDLVRPVLGNEERPYPRRCRTGRPRTETDPDTETRIEKPHPVYVPRDETFEEVKQETYAAGKLRGLLHNLMPMIASKLSSEDVLFTHFSEIDNLYKTKKEEEQEEEEAKKNRALGILMNKVLNFGDKLFKYKIPAIIKRDRFAWLRDNEFARQTLAGVNPVNIELLKVLPIISKLDPAKYGPPESAVTKDLIAKKLNGICTVEEAIRDKKLFILDYHDLLLPFIEDMNSLPDRKAYASRTIFYYSETGALRPIAIELSLPPTPSSPRNKYVFTHGHDATTHWKWKLAKAHVCSNDAGVHQLVNHWLRTHACMEPYIIATHRQLSSMHPVYKLLHPHMRYTMEINALARQGLINGDGVIETCFSPGKYAMEISCASYKSFWRFDMEALPADLLRRGMAVEDPVVPRGVKLVIEDYPYAADGLLIWSAMKDLVESYVEHYYSEPNSISSDVELQAWWDDIKNKGHYNKKDEPWWPKLTTQDDLSNILTTIMWTASSQHAAINFGQYPFGGYPPNRPTLMRKLIPQEGEADYEEFLQNPEFTFLTSLPSQLQATKVMAVQDSLSTHSADEEYLNQLHDIHRLSFNDPEVHKLFENFSVKLDEIELIIHERNKDRELTNRTGAGVPPYELLLPSSPPGVTGRGVPNSISI